MSGDLQHPIHLDARQAEDADAEDEDGGSGSARRPPMQAAATGPEGLQRHSPGVATDAGSSRDRDEPGSDAESSGSYGRCEQFCTSAPMACH